MVSWIAGSNTVSANMEQSEIKQRLAPYSEWMQEVNGEIQLQCPREDVGEEQMFSYLMDISSLLYGTPGEDYCKVDILFPYSVKNNGTDVNRFAETMFAREDKFNYYLTNWSDLHRLDFKVGRRYLGSETISYNVSVELVQNGSIRYSNSSIYYDKLWTIVNEAKQQATNDMELVWYFCRWMEKNVVYDITLQTNSAYVAIVEQKALCGGYANALKDLCSLVGIETLVPTNQALDHAWSEVFIDGTWYTVDLCYIVRSSSGTYQMRYFFTDPNKIADDVSFENYIKNELAFPTPILNSPDIISVGKNSYNLSANIRKLADNATVTYSSSNSKVAQVDGSGNIKSISKGNAVITVNVSVNGKNYVLEQKVEAAYETPESAASKIKTTKVKLSKVTNLKGRKVKLSWKKVKNADGYQIRYATNKKFTKGKKNVTAKASATKKTIKKLKKKKTYYFKIRAYKKVNGKKVYGKWSKTKKVKISK